MLKVGWIHLCPSLALGGVCCESCCMQDAEAGKGWGVGEAVAV